MYVPEKVDTFVTVRMSQAQKDAIFRAAEEMNVSASTYMKLKALGDLDA